MLEIEVKYRVADFGTVEADLKRLGADSVEVRDDADTYFNAPHRDFAVTDEALRVRTIGAKNFITYKGPRTDKQTKTREEIEVPFADGADAAGDIARILTALSFRRVAVVHKRRRVWEFERDSFQVQACLDDVAGVGRFVELEIVAEPARFEAARTVVLACAVELRLIDMERRSYLELLLESRVA